MVARFSQLRMVLRLASAPMNRSGGLPALRLFGTTAGGLEAPRYVMQVFCEMQQWRRDNNEATRSGAAISGRAPVTAQDLLDLLFSARKGFATAALAARLNERTTNQLDGCLVATAAPSTRAVDCAAIRRCGGDYLPCISVRRRSPLQHHSSMSSRDRSPTGSNRAREKKRGQRLTCR